MRRPWNDDSRPSEVAAVGEVRRCRFQSSRLSLVRRMIFWQLVPRGKAQQRTGIPSLVTAIPITTSDRLPDPEYDILNPT